MPDTKLLRIFRSSLEENAKMFYEHHHTAFEITMILSGSGIYATRTHEFEFTPGDVFFFSTDEVHWIKKLNEKTNFLNIHFEPRYLWSDSFGISESLSGIFLRCSKNHCNKLKAECAMSENIRNFIFRMEQEDFEKNAEYQTVEKLLLVNILVEVLRSMGEDFADNNAKYTKDSIKCIERALRYIDAHLTEDMTLEEIADAASMSRNYFCRQFKGLNGISPWDYITVKRIEKAKDYLKNTELTRLEIAALCGYNNTANFYHAFKKVTGMSPGEYINCRKSLA